MNKTKRITSLITSVVVAFSLGNFKIVKNNDYSNNYVIEFNNAKSESEYYLYEDTQLPNINNMSYMDKLNTSLVPIYGLQTGLLDIFGDVIDKEFDKNSEEYINYMNAINMFNSVSTEEDFFKIYELIKPGYNRIMEIICNYLSTLEPVQEFNPTNLEEIYSMSQRLNYETTIIFLSHILDNDGYIYKNYVTDLALLQNCISTINIDSDYETVYKKIKPLYEKVYKELLDIQKKNKLKPNYNNNGKKISFNNEEQVIEEIPDEDYLFKDMFDPFSKIDNLDKKTAVYAMTYPAYRLIDENKIADIITITNYDMDSPVAKPFWDYVKTINTSKFRLRSDNYDVIYRGYLDLLDHLYLYFNYNHLNNPDLNPINYDKMIDYNKALNIEVLFIVDLYETYYEDRISEDLWNNIYKLITGTIPYYDKESNFDKDLTISKELYSNLYYGLIDYYNYFNETYLNNIVKTK